MNLVLECVNEQEDLEIGEPLLEMFRMLLRLAGEEEGVQAGEVSLSFVDDAQIQQLNKEYRGLDKPTDVLSFALMETGEDELLIRYDDLEEEAGEPLGDIVISVPRALAQAEEYGHSVERELGFLFVHGFLHLIGYDHNTEEEERDMFGRQERILEKAGISR